MRYGSINRSYKDKLFKLIFGNPENKKWTLSLYNAMNGSNYDNPDDIICNVIEDAIYVRMGDDVSFVIEDTVSLCKQQSTYCPNIMLKF